MTSKTTEALPLSEAIPHYAGKMSDAQFREKFSWQPIETMPPEGRNVILFTATDIGPNGEIRNWRMDTGSFHGPARGGNWNVGNRWLEPWDPRPTHWMPLPEPPTI